MLMAPTRTQWAVYSAKVSSPADKWLTFKGGRVVGSISNRKQTAGEILQQCP